MTLPVFRSSSITTTGVSPTHVDPGKPSGTVGTDVLVAIVENAGSDSPAPTITPPSGWTIGPSRLQTDSVQVVGLQASVYWALGSVASTDFALGNSIDASATILAYSGADNAAPFGESSANGGNRTGTLGSQTIAALSITTTHTDDMVIAAWCENGSTMGAVPWTLRADTGADPRIKASDNPFASPQATGDQTTTINKTNQWCAFQVAILPPGASAYFREFGAAVKSSGLMGLFSATMAPKVLQPEFHMAGLLALYYPRTVGPLLTANLEPGLGRIEDRKRFPSVSQPFGGQSGWMNPNNVYLDDSLYATQSHKGNGFTGNWSTFGYDVVIPSAARVTRVEAIVRIKADIEDANAIAYVNVDTASYASGDVQVASATKTERTYTVNLTSAMGIGPGGGPATEFYDSGGAFNVGVSPVASSNQVTWSLNSVAVRLTWLVPSGANPAMFDELTRQTTRPVRSAARLRGPFANFATRTSFEPPLGVSGWIADWATAAVTSAQAFHGTQSAELTAINTNSFTFDQFSVTQNVLVQPGVNYIASFYVRPNTTVRNVTVYIGWYDAAGNAISTSSGSAVAETSGAWLRVDSGGSHPAPVNAATARGSITIANPVASEIHYVDAYQFEVGDAPTAYDPNEAVLLKQTRRPFAPILSFVGATVRNTGKAFAAVFAPLGPPPQSPYRDIVLNDSPIMYWRLGESSGPTAADDSGSGNTGTYQNSPSFSKASLLPSTTNTSVGFNGQTHYVDGFDINAIDGASALTVEMWVCPDQTRNTMTLMLKGASGAPSRNVFWIRSPGGGSTDGDIWAYIPVNGTDFGTRGHSPGNTIRPGVTTHLVMVFDGAGSANADRLKIYANGVSQTLAFDGTIPASLPTGSTDILTLGRFNGDSEYYSGIFDEVAIYTTALSGSTISNHYNAGLRVGLVKRTLRPIAATLALIGALTKQTRRQVAATLSFIGTLAKQTNRALAAVLSFLGSMATVYTPFAIIQNLFATLSFVGGVTKQTNKALPATLSFIGTVTKSILYALTATLSFIGTLTKQTNRLLAATLSFVGYLLRGRVMAATLSFVGAVTKQTSKPQAATLSFVGALPKQIRRLVVAVLGLGTSGGPVVFDAKTNPAAGVGVSSMTFSHTTGGANRYLFVPVFTAAPQTPTSVTYAGVDMVRLGGIDNGPLDARQEIYGLVNPPLGANNVIVTLGSSATNLLCAAVSFNGVHQTKSVGAFVSGNTVTITITDSVAGDLVIDAAGSDNFSTVDPSQTEVWNVGASWASAGSYKAGASGNVDMTWTNLTFPRHIGMAIKQGTGGGLFKQTRRLLAGVLSFIGSLVTLKAFNRALAATLSFVGSQAKQTNKALTATLSLVGAVVKFTSRALAATLFFVGALTKQTRRLLAAVLSFVGTLTLIKAFGKALSATLSFVGSQAKQTTHVMPATLSFIGTVAKFTSRALAATLSFVGTLTKQTNRLLVATLSFVGATTTVKALNKALSATLSFVGAVSRQTTHVMPATLSFVGTIPARAIGALLTGTLSFVGALTKQTRHTLTAATLAFIGTLTQARQFFRTLAATASFVGAVSRQGGKLAAGTLTFAGAVTRRTGHLAAATLALSGAIPVRAITHLLTATSALVGNVFKRITKIPFLATLAFVGTGIFIRVTLKLQALFATVAFSGGLTFGRRKLFVTVLGLAGQVNRSTSRLLAGALSFVGFLQRLLRIGKLPIGKTSYQTYFHATTSCSSVLVGATSYQRKAA